MEGRKLPLGVAAVLAAAAVGPMSLLSTPAIAAPRSDQTSPLEARRVDRVKLPKINWSTCTTAGGECAEIRLPLDYDEPNGATTLIALGRTKAARPNQRIGTLFVNPGGPGASASENALQADEFLDQRILDRFDVVGVDPRGVGFGDRVTCFASTQEQTAATEGFSDVFPVTKAEIKAYIRASRAQAKGCGTTGLPLAGSMSTAQVARDMDVVRRALGDKKLTFFGVSYGTQLGQVYANLFPDRVRAMVLDGVVDPVAFTTGRHGEGRKIPVDDRMRTADGSYLALRELMLRCDKAGAPTCAFAGSGDSLKKFDLLTKRLRKTPLTTKGSIITYPRLMVRVASALYSPAVGPQLMDTLQVTFTATDPAMSASSRADAGRKAAAGIAQLRASLQTETPQVRRALRADDESAYINDLDAYYAVTCSDTVNPKSPQTWISTSKAADRRAPYFGSLWNWASTSCADSIWTARDEDRYLGPFTKRTANPVLVVGNYYDPATPYRFGAVAASKLLPNSRLLTSDSWGHAAYGTSACVSNAIGAYLLQSTLPTKGKICTGPQPFEGTVAPQSSARSGSGSTARPVPIRPFVPGLSG